MVLQNIVLPRDGSDKRLDEKNSCPGTVDFVVMSFNFMKGNGPLLTVWSLHCGSIVEYGVEFFEVLEDSCREVFGVSEDYDGVGFLKGGFFDNCFCCSGEGGDIRKTDGRVILNFVGSACALLHLCLACGCFVGVL